MQAIRNRDNNWTRSYMKIVHDAGATADDEVALYIARLKDSNEKLAYWQNYLNERFNGQAALDFLGISLWEVLIGSWAVQDCFSNNAAVCGRKILIRGLAGRIVKFAKKFLRRAAVFLQKPATEPGGICLVAFERRQLETFLDAMSLMDKRSIKYSVITAKPSLYISLNFASLASFAAMLARLISIRGWIKKVLSDSSSLPEEKLNELKIVLGLLSKGLYSALSSVVYSEGLISRSRPRKMAAADNSDPRVRSLFLTARKYGIETFHVPYSFANYDSFEEKYPVADKKLVYSDNHKSLLTREFGLEEQNIYTLGSPRFDGLFKVRDSAIRGAERKEFTVYLGSQPAVLVAMDV
jgi:hypothetical protein